MHRRVSRLSDVYRDFDVRDILEVFEEFIEGQKLTKDQTVVDMSG